MVKKLFRDISLFFTYDIIDFPQNLVCAHRMLSSTREIFVRIFLLTFQNIFPMIYRSTYKKIKSGFRWSAPGIQI
jgi:hypothetical protein